MRTSLPLVQWLRQHTTQGSLGSGYWSRWPGTCGNVRLVPAGTAPSSSHQQDTSPGVRNGRFFAKARPAAQDRSLDRSHHFDAVKMLVSSRHRRFSYSSTERHARPRDICSSREDLPETARHVSGYCVRAQSNQSFNGDTAEDAGQGLDDDRRV